MSEDLFRRLKEWLREKKANYVEHHSWMGDTEGGFYDTDEFDFDKLCAEIDAFHAELTANAGGSKSWPQEEKA